MINPKLAAAVLIPFVVAGCGKSDPVSSAGVTVVRSACPVVAIPVGTGDATYFNPPSSRDAEAIDVVVSMTNLRGTCNEGKGANIVSNATFELRAIRQDARGARDIVVPYFATVVQAGNNVVSKSVSRVSLHFNDGELRASTTGSATSTVSRSAATLPADIRKEITRERKSGDTDAAVDPMTSPKIRAAVQRASFELLVGIQLTPEQLAYNMTR